MVVITAAVGTDTRSEARTDKYCSCYSSSRSNSCCHGDNSNNVIAVAVVVLKVAVAVAVVGVKIAAAVRIVAILL